MVACSCAPPMGVIDKYATTTRYYYNHFAAVWILSGTTRMS